MAIDTSIPRTRRALLAGGLGGLAALVASALGRPLVASAADGEVVLVGSSYTATNMTKITNTANNHTVLAGEGHSGTGVMGSSASGRGVYGYAKSLTGSIEGVYGRSESADGTGVLGYAPALAGHTRGVHGRCVSPGGIGVHGEAYAPYGESKGVYGWSASSEGSGVYGQSAGQRTGVVGYSGADPIPLPVAKTGVYGYAAQDAMAVGVRGHSTTGYGVRGSATTGTAGYFASADPTKGYALRTVGRVRMDKSAGIATINGGNVSQTVTPGIDLVSTSAVVATLQGDAGGAVVERVVVNTTANTFTIYLTTWATRNVKVAWHVFG